MLLQSSILAVLGLTSTAHAWGNLGHEIIGFVATDFLTPATLTWVQGILGDTSTTALATAATWADTYKYTTAGEWSRDLHYIDANDNPPTACSVDYTRDCIGGICVVNAIHNFTTLLAASGSSAANHLLATRMILHFIGDVHQPLHDEALDVGGNTIPVTYDGATTNLHSIWDTEMLEQLTGGTTITTARTYATVISNQLKQGTAGSYGWTPSSWVSGMTLANPQTTALSWASEANKYVCSDVIPAGVAAVEGIELDGAYYTAHYHAVRIQVARAGYRLAAWLNLIHTGATGL